MPIGNPTSPSIINPPVSDTEPLFGRTRKITGLRRPLSRLAVWGVAVLAPALPASAMAADASATSAAGVESTAPERRDQILESAATFAKGITSLSALGKAACKRQKELDARSFTTCEYPGAFAAAKKRYPLLVSNRGISRPGTEDKADRKRLYWIAYPGEYRLMRQETEAGMYYTSPRQNMWDRVNDRECRDTWNCNTGNGYYGGLQMDRDFQQTYNPHAFILWGTADKWPKPAQLKAADLAYVSRGLRPWPSSYKAEGSFPCPVSARASIRARC